MQLNQDDIIAVAKSRVTKQENKVTTKWMWGMIVGIFIGFILLWQVNSIAGYAVAIVSVIAFLYYNSTLSKKQKTYVYKMLQEWQAEQKKVEVK